MSAHWIRRAELLAGTLVGPVVVVDGGCGLTGPLEGAGLGPS